MKKLNKILLTSGGTLLLCTGSVTAYLQAQPKEQLSDLTLANIEALGYIYESDTKQGTCDPPYNCTCTYEIMNPAHPGQPAGTPGPEVVDFPGIFTPTN